jgi:hypothetical protein
MYPFSLLCRLKEKKGYNMMETEEKRNDEKKTVEAWPTMSCYGTDTGPWKMSDCCKSFFKTHDYSSMMDKCMRMCRWFPLVPVIFGISVLLLGYYLDASTARVLWMFVGGFITLMGVLGLILAGRMKRMCCGSK